MAVIHNEADFLKTCVGTLNNGTFHRVENDAGAVAHSVSRTLDNCAFQVEAVVCATAAAEGLPHFWVWFGDASLGGVVKVEVRLTGAGAVKRVELWDLVGNARRAVLDVDWTDSADWLRVRLKRQRVGGTDYLYLQAERSSGWDDPATPHGVVANVSQREQLTATLFVPHASGPSQVGFGHAAGNPSASDWESIHLTIADDLETVLPYWPAAADAPLASATSDLDVKQTVTASHDLSGWGYLATDRATPKLLTPKDGVTHEGVALVDPGNVGINPVVTNFSEIDDDQTVQAWATLVDLCGRATDSQKAPVSIPDCTSPDGEVTIRTSVSEAPPKAVYNGSEAPTAVIVDVTEAHLDEASSYVQFNGTKTYFTGLANPYTVPIAPLQGENGVVVHLQDAAGHVWDRDTTFKFDSVAPTARMQVCPGVPTDDLAWTNLVPGMAFGGPVYVGVLLTNLAIDDLSYRDSAGGPAASHMNLDGDLRILDTSDSGANGFSEKNSLVVPNETRIWWNTRLTLEETYTLSFRLEDLAGNVTVLGPVSFDLDITAPTGKLQARASATDPWKDLPAEFATPPSDLCVAVPISVDDLAPAASSMVVDGVSTPLGPAGVTVAVDAEYTRYILSGAIGADGVHTVAAHLADLATPANTGDVSSTVGVGKPSFFFEGNRYNTENAALISHTSAEGTDNDPQGLLLTGASSNNYLAVRVRNGGPVAGDVKFRIFVVPACLFTGTAQWRLAHDGAPGSIAAMPPGSQASKNNVNFKEGHPNFPGEADPLWASHSSGDLLHACACAVLHSPQDPLMLPNGAGDLAPVGDAEFDDPAAFKAAVMARIDSYTGGTGKYWEAVGSNTKIANRNINVKKVGV